MTAPPVARRFAGFPPEGLAFLGGLAADNTKAYFDAHRPLYERAVRQPLEDVVGEGEAIYGAGRVFRANRDVRFSADKSPYKTTAAGYAQAGPCLYYVALDPEGMWVGGGLYHPERAVLSRVRERIAADAGTAAGLREALAGLEAAGFERAGGALKTAPRGIPRDHPAIAELRLTGYAAIRRFAPGPEVHDPEAARAAVLSSWAGVAGGLGAWLAEHAAA